MENYLKILEESLVKKKAVLQQIEEVNQNQAKLLQAEMLDVEAFDKCVDQKDAMIGELNKLDDGFESLYDRIREQLMQNRPKYSAQIAALQKLIGEITDASVSIQAQESRNKLAVERYFARQRNDLGKGRKASKAAYGYYKNNVGVADSYFMDTKK